jgi:hypothetical protein
METHFVFETSKYSDSGTGELLFANHR